MCRRLAVWVRAGSGIRSSSYINTRTRSISPSTLENSPFNHWELGSTLQVLVGGTRRSPLHSLQYCLTLRLAIFENKFLFRCQDNLPVTSCTQIITRINRYRWHQENKVKIIHKIFNVFFFLSLVPCHVFFVLDAYWLRIKFHVEHKFSVVIIISSI